MDEDYSEESGGGAPSTFGLVVFFSVLFFPAVAFGFVVYNLILLRAARLRFGVIAMLSVPVLILNTIVFMLSGGFGAIADFFIHITKAGDTWPTLILPVTCLYVYIGVVVGLILVFWNAREMRVNPWRLTHNTNWMYKFSYRRTPLQYFRFKKRIEELKKGDYTQEGFSPLGLQDEGTDDVVGRYAAEAVKHTLITGAPGSGKSISMLSLMYSDIETNVTCFCIDFKRDPELASKLATWAKENNRPFYHFVNGEPEEYDIANSPGQACYDAIATGTPTSNADLLLSMREYDTASAVYKAAMTQVLQILLNMVYVVRAKKAQHLVKADWKSGGFFTLASLLNAESIGAMANVCQGTDLEQESRALYEAITGRTQEAHALDELRGQLRTLTASEYGRWLRLREGFNQINLLELSLTPGAVVLYSLNSDSEKEFSAYMGSIIMGDLTNVSALRRNSGRTENPVHVYVDEFQVVNPTSVAGLLEKSRASNMSITLAQQSLEQIVASSMSNGEAYLNSVLDTCGNFLIHNGSVESSALYFSNILGKVEKQQYMVSRKNESFFGAINFSNRRKHRVSSNTVVDWEREPKFFMELDSPSKENGYRSTAVWLNKTSSDPKFRGSRGAKAQRVNMIPNVRVLETYYSTEKARRKMEREYSGNTEANINVNAEPSFTDFMTAPEQLPQELPTQQEVSAPELVASAPEPVATVHEVPWQKTGKKRQAKSQVATAQPTSFAEMISSGGFAAQEPSEDEVKKKLKLNPQVRIPSKKQDPPESDFALPDFTQNVDSRMSSQENEESLPDLEF